MLRKIVFAAVAAAAVGVAAISGAAPAQAQFFEVQYRGPGYGYGPPPPPPWVVEHWRRHHRHGEYRHPGYGYRSGYNAPRYGWERREGPPAWAYGDRGW